MGFFDFLKGPQLNRWEAHSVASNIALRLYLGFIDLDQLILYAETELEFQFKLNFPDHSIEPEQSKQLLRLAILYFEEEKEYLENLKERRLRAAVRQRYGPDIVKPKKYYYRDYLTLFPDNEDP